MHQVSCAHEIFFSFQPMRTLMPAALLSAVLLLALVPKRSVSFVLSVAGFLLVICALVVTFAVEVSIDDQIKAWTVATLPTDWQAMRDRWGFYHGLRTLLSIFALASVSASNLSNLTPNELPSGHSRGYKHV